jgi:unsaturated chondroitin disaccharide hydrolase
MTSPSGGSKRSGLEPGWVLTTCAERVRRHAEREVFPQYTEGGVWRLTDPHDKRPAFMPEDACWTSGFWPGMLWIASAVLDDPHMAARADDLTSMLRSRSTDDRTHDLGFLFMPSAVLGSAVTGRPDSLEGAFEAASTLLARWDRVGGYLRAWGEQGSTQHEGVTTIDALMNAAFVLWASMSMPSQEGRALALRHAENALKYQLRDDGSSIQVAQYDRMGAFVKGSTHQGHSSDSCWSRGQSWAIYGFALVAALSGQRHFAAAAQAAGDYFVGHLLANGMAPWDFLDTTPSRTIVDSSAMAIAAAGLLCLATLTAEASPRRQGLALLETLSDRALVADAGSPALLAHGTLSLPRGIGVDESLIFGDFYFMDALSRATGSDHADYLRARPPVVPATGGGSGNRAAGFLGIQATSPR